MVVLQLLVCWQILAGGEPGNIGALCKGKQHGMDGEEGWMVPRVPGNELMILLQYKTVDGTRSL